MSEEVSIAGGLNVLFWGMPFGVSTLVLQRLLDSGVGVACVVLPADAVPHLLADPRSPWSRLEPPAQPGRLMLSNHTTGGTLEVAWAAGLPVFAVGDLSHGDTLALFAALGADLAVVGCFTHRIPHAVRQIPRLGFLNLHPSLLPAYRGPTPVFWQLRDGAETGVTVHYMDAGLDTGDIAAQAAVPLPDGIGEAAAEQRLMLNGVELLRGVLAELAEGMVRRRPQPPGGSYFGFPNEADFALATEWPARRAYNFMRGTAARGLPYTVDIAGRTELLATADHYEGDLILDRESVRHSRNILIQFNPGVLYTTSLILNGCSYSRALE
ncbi:MAG: hypothetical protein KC410_13390 [Anaerolineales bacterium]|uniref:methionyl-tRNA formyltransferase n=1 Tax=Promineifilum sp. TaxID=2664178 RepID=UPI001D7C1A8D|nr:hypothetical protein [Anaerolineales bacterium]MCO5179611.1 hypothetical protein [Promineifilum sp.]